VNRHESLRSCFFTQASTGLPVQALLKKPVDCFHHIPYADQGHLDAEIEELNTRPWDLANGKGFKITLLSFSAEVHRLVIGYHHIVMDGVSMHILLRELHAVYSGKELVMVPLQYLDSAAAEYDAFNSGAMDDKISYWRSELSPPPEPLPLLRFSRTKTRRAAVKIRNREARRNIGPELTKKVKLTGQKMNVTPFYIYTATIQLLLHRLLGVSDICIGALDANRNDDNQGIIGLYLNMLPLRFEIDGRDTFSHLVAKTSQKYRSALANAGVPFDAMIKDAGVGRDATCTPLFQVAINYRQGQFFNLPLGNARMDCVTTSEAKSPFDIVFCVTPAEDTCWVQVITRGDLYDDAAAQEILNMYSKLLAEIVREPSMSLQEFQPYDQARIDAALQIGQAKVEHFGWPVTLSEKIDEVLAEYPDDVAVTDDRQNLTYRQLQRKRDALQLAIELQSPGPSRVIAVLLQPGVGWPVSMLAIMRAGATFVPLDASLPDERLRQILLISQATLLLHNHDTAERAYELSENSTNLDKMNIDQLEADILASTSIKETPGSQCFILFTSGSTGVPKGIKLSQTGFINYVASKGQLLSLQREIVLQQSALGFDMALAQAWQSLCRGGTLVIAPQHARGDPVALSELMIRHGVTFTLGTPTEYSTLLRYGIQDLKSGSAWKYACSGGEAITDDLKQDFRFMQQAPILADCYGPTEISCCATMNVVDLNESTDTSIASVGRANPNTSIYILDDNGSVLPIGHRGEIAIGGVGVALGYLDEYNTARAFVPHPSGGPDAQILYKTGDSGILQGDGSLNFQGRMDGDTTIKIRGLRVDLEEIGKCMLQTSKSVVEDVVVTARGDPAFLVAHVVLASGFDEQELSLLSLASTLPLPQYMKPAVVQALPRLPVSSNGKVDRKAISLLPLTTDNASSQVTRPLTLVEGELKLIWDRALSHKKASPSFGPEADFFQVGGTSLALIKLQAYMHSSMSVEVSLHDLYNSSTLQGMAALVSDRKASHRPVVIDWDFETDVPADIQLATTHSTARSGHSDDIEILLTGSTGFLGVAILKALLQQPSVERIHCLAIDSDDLRQHIQDPRLTLYRGSLDEPRLGLDQATFDNLLGKIHRIIHAGARGHCLNNFTTLRTANLGATRSIALAAAKYQIPIHYVSSNRVTLLNPDAGAALPPVSVAAYQPKVDGSEGFTASKWAGEVLLEKLGLRTSDMGVPVPITIHRPCAVTGSEAPAEDALNAVLRMSRALHAVPALAEMNVQGYFDFLDVHIVAEEIAGAVVKSQNATEMETANHPTQFRHYSSGSRVPPEEFRQHMETTSGEKFEELPFYTWLAAAREAGMEDIISSYLEAVVQKKGMLQYPFMGQRK
jgi:aspyridone synthetase (hybrid polyketide synthase/nonribosomal peptide synthetase)